MDAQIAAGMAADGASWKDHYAYLDHRLASNRGKEDLMRAELDAFTAKNDKEEKENKQHQSWQQSPDGIAATLDSVTAKVKAEADAKAKAKAKADAHSHVVSVTTANGSFIGTHTKSLINQKNACNRCKAGMVHTPRYEPTTEGARNGGEGCESAVHHLGTLNHPVWEEGQSFAVDQAIACHDCKHIFARRPWWWETKSGRCDFCAVPLCVDRCQSTVYPG